MPTLLEKISDLNDMILQGKALEAFEKYYSDEVIMQENNDPKIIGKDANRKREEEFFAGIIEFRSAKPLHVSIGEGVTMVEWHFDYTHKEFGMKNFTQVAVQEWKKGKISKEKFYYSS